MPTSLRAPLPPHLPPPKKKKEKKIFDPSAIFPLIIFFFNDGLIPGSWRKKKEQRRRRVNARESDRENTLRVPRMPVAPANRAVLARVADSLHVHACIYTSISASRISRDRDAGGAANGSTWGIAGDNTRGEMMLILPRSRDMRYDNAAPVCVCTLEKWSFDSIYGSLCTAVLACSYSRRIYVKKQADVFSYRG